MLVPWVIGQSSRLSRMPSRSASGKGSILMTRFNPASTYQSLSPGPTSRPMIELALVSTVFM